MILISFVFMTLIINSIESNQIIQLDQVSLSEETDYKNYVIYNFTNSYKLQLIPSSEYFEIDGSKLNVNYKFDREGLIEASLCQTNCILELKIASYDENNNIAKIYNLPVLISDINDNKPEFKNEIITLNISENLSSKTIVSLEPPSDLDSGENSIQNCQILSETDLFSLNFNTENKNLFLVIETPLDRENKSEYFLNISCSDNLSEIKAKLIINVLDTNDNVPYFLTQDYNVTIPENILSDNLVQIKAHDLDDPSTSNAKLTFTLDQNPDWIKNTFFINQSSGIIGLVKELDFEKVKKYILKVKVNDQGPNPVPIYTNVYINVIDINDNAPTAHLSFMDKYISNENRANNTIWIEEEQNSTLPLGFGFLTLSDLDSAQVNGFNLTAELISINYMDTKTGKMQVENDLSFKLSPVIQEYNNVIYSLQQIKNLDREEKAFFDIEIKLSDNNGIFSLKNQQKQTSLVRIRIILNDINDNSPSFRQDKFSFVIKENLMALNFGSIEAFDADLNSQLEFRIMDSSDDDLNPNFIFFINPSNGSLSLRAGLDREKKDFYTFKVKVSDGKFSSDIQVDIKVLDENDNEPFYAENIKIIEIEENLRLNSIIGNVKPIDYDLDSKFEYLIEPLEANNYFLIESKTGNLKTAVKIDAEKFHNFTFKILVKDSEFPEYSSSLNVSIFVKDLNDNQPELIIQNSVVVFDGNCSSVNITDMFVRDLDRDLINRQNSVKIGQIRRLNWHLVAEILKNYNNKSSDLNELISFLDFLPHAKAQKNNLRNFFSLNSSDESLSLNLVNSCKLNSGFYNLSIQVNDSEVVKYYSIKVLVFNSSSNLSDYQRDLLGNIVEQWWAINSIYLSKKIKENQDDLDSFIYSSNLTDSRRLLGLTGLILFSKGSSSSNFLILSVLSFFIIVIVILLITILYKSLQFKPKFKSVDKKMLNLKLESNDSNSLSSSKIKNMSLKGDSFTVITSLPDRARPINRDGSISEESYMRTFSSKTDDNLQVNDMGYYGSSDYSDSFQQRNSKKLKNDSFTSSSVLSSPSTTSDTSSNYRPVVTNLYPFKPVETKQSDVKIYLERFERIYNSDSLENSAQNRITTYSYV
ncbi:unnamed protein product [Brachionus calyciflorus]|uniref:Cadherin domain-containing protein n=1 Tax=Brachionus calyciflorus TaxID=104777 RepID=A0A813MAC9_9BILA|nr:unnamed protein product [Brachionus calyciflorus]